MKPVAHGLVPVRLDRIRIDVRIAAARSLRKDDKDIELLAAAVCPSDRVYWLSAAAQPILDQVAA